MFSQVKFAAIAVIALIAGNVEMSFAQKVIGVWSVTSGPDGKSATMVYANPATTLKVESEFSLTVDPMGNPTSGAIKFKNGFQREMTAGEVAFYFMEHKADNAYWDFRDNLGSITKFTSATDPLPTNFYGQQVRVISKEGVHYIGILSPLTLRMIDTSAVYVNSATARSTSFNPDWFSLNIKGNRLLVYRNAIQEIEQLK
jgi:hypothetical protein